MGLWNFIKGLFGGDMKINLQGAKDNGANLVKSNNNRVNNQKSYKFLNFSFSRALTKQQKQELRQELYLEIEIKIQQYLPENLINHLYQDKTSLWRLMKVLDTARRSNPEKIKFFANLLGSSCKLNNPISQDEFDEYLSIITELSCREMYVLNFIATFTSLNKKNLATEDHTMLVREDFDRMILEISQQINQEKTLVWNILERLKSAGLYQYSSSAGAFGYEVTIDGQSRSAVMAGVSALYHKLKEAALQEVVSKYPS